MNNQEKMRKQKKSKVKYPKLEKDRCHSNRTKIQIQDKHLDQDKKSRSNWQMRS